MVVKQETMDYCDPGRRTRDPRVCALPIALVMAGAGSVIASLVSRIGYDTDVYFATLV